MKKREAINRIKEHMRIHGIGQPPHVYIAEALNLAIEALEKPDLAWKPCIVQLPKSGLPDENGHNEKYLVTVKRDCGYAYRTIATRIEECWHTETGFDFEDDETIIAWQPLPEPYDPDRKEDAKSDDVSQWPDWKKRAALCNYEFGKED